MVSSILPDCVMEMDILSKCKMFPLPSITKQMVCESSLRTILIEQAKWKTVRFHEPTQCRIEAGVLVGANSLFDSSRLGYGKSL